MLFLWEKLNSLELLSGWHVSNSFMTKGITRARHQILITTKAWFLHPLYFELATKIKHIQYSSNNHRNSMLSPVLITSVHVHTGFIGNEYEGWQLLITGHNIRLFHYLLTFVQRRRNNYTKRIDCSCYFCRAHHERGFYHVHEEVPRTFEFIIRACFIVMVKGHTVQ